MQKSEWWIIGLAVTVVSSVVTAGLHTVERTEPQTVPLAAIDCGNFTQASTCAFGIADYGGQLLGQADFCEMPRLRTERLKDAIQNALTFMADSPNSVIPGSQLMSEVERRSAKRARFHVLPIDCVIVERDFLELMRELGVRPSPDDDLEQAG